jgi:glutamate-5-semialdehyde dehydrogenase
MMIQKNLIEEMNKIGERAKQASNHLAQASSTQKNKALTLAAQALKDHRGDILKANEIDCESARSHTLSPQLIDRLWLDEKRVFAMAKGLEDIAELPDPIGEVIAHWTRPNGLDISRIRVPLGVIGIIYESRPNVTADAGALCLKSGNAAILRGGSESFHSSQVILTLLQKGLEASGLPNDCLQAVPTKDRDAVGIMLKMNEFIDVIVPRGGKSLIERIISESRIPLFQHLEGNNHCYVEKTAQPAMARQIVMNAKMRRPSICGATETLLIDKDLVVTLLPELIDDLLTAGCEIRGDDQTQSLDSRVNPASEQDWSMEYLDKIIAVRVVEDYHEAIAHIQRYSSHHTEAIISENKDAVDAFFKKIDSAILLHNASTQYADGGEFGMGAEIGIATGKLHARGPVGLEQLTSFKYLVRGNGQVRP